MAPSEYPNLEISDEGYLWVNIDSSMGTIEVLAFQFHVRQKTLDCIRSKNYAISNLKLEKRIYSLTRKCASRDGILAAYKRDEHSQLVFTSDFDEILLLKKKGVFFSYLGVRFPVAQKTVSETENTIKDIVSCLESR